MQGCWKSNYGFYYVCTNNAWVLHSSMVPSICKSYQSTGVCSTAIHKTSTTTPFTYLRRALCQIGNKPFGIATTTRWLTSCYKIIHGLGLLSCDRSFTIIYDHLTRGHSLKLFVSSSRVNCRQHFFRCSCNWCVELTTWRRHISKTIIVVCKSSKIISYLFYHYCYHPAWASLAPLWLNLTKSGVSKDSVSPPSSEYTPLLCSR